MEVYEELAAIFSQDNNEETHRDVLMREGTAKFAISARDTDRHLNKVLQKQNMSTSHGTIPYLGIFLTDLTMIHTAIPDMLPNTDFINFDKKRKEFEVLAQIKLLQGAANAYRLADDPMFDRWFASVPVLTERQAHDRSCVLEPPEPKEPPSATAAAALNATSASSKSSTSKSAHGHRKSASIASNSSSGAGSQHDFGALGLVAGGGAGSAVASLASRNNSLDRQAEPLPNESIMSATSSMSSLSLESSSASGAGGVGGDHQHRPQALPGNGLSTIAPSIVNGQLHQTNAEKNGEPKFLIIRVSFQSGQTERDGLLQYKSIMLYNSDRTSHVIRNAMLKLDLAGDPDQWTLVYCLPDNEMIIGPNTNVFYAVDKKVSLNFMLRSKRSGKWENLI